MSIIKKVLFALQADMPEPVPYGWYHWLWIVLGVATVALLYSQRHRMGEKQYLFSPSYCILTEILRNRSLKGPNPTPKSRVFPCSHQL